MSDYEISDLEDPAHDQEILDLLFYKNSTGNVQSKQVRSQHKCLLIRSWGTHATVK